MQIDAKTGLMRFDAGQKTVMQIDAAPQIASNRIKFLPLDAEVKT
jgi:hypothetical protein